jgi:hypothetical protein
LNEERSNVAELDDICTGNIGGRADVEGVVVISEFVGGV